MQSIHQRPEAYRHAWDKIKWTQLDEATYYKLIGELRSCASSSEPFWKLERFWTVTKTQDSDFSVRRTPRRRR